MLPRVRMGEGCLARTPHPFECAGRSLCPLPQGERARKARAAHFARILVEARRSVLMLRDASQRVLAVGSSCVLVALRRSSAGGRSGPTCGCTKWASAQFPCFGPVLYREPCNSHVLPALSLQLRFTAMWSNSPMRQPLACASLMRNGAARSVCSPPPCGEGLGVGVDRYKPSRSPTNWTGMIVDKSSCIGGRTADAVYRDLSDARAD